MYNTKDRIPTRENLRQYDSTANKQNRTVNETKTQLRYPLVLISTLTFIAIWIGLILTTFPAYYDIAIQCSIIIVCLAFFRELDTKHNNDSENI